MLSYATPDGKSLEAIQALEKKTGKTILAYNLWEPADLSDEELKAIQDLEKETCYTLIAIKSAHD